MYQKNERMSIIKFNNNQTYIKYIKYIREYGIISHVCPKNNTIYLKPFDDFFNSFL